MYDLPRRDRVIKPLVRSGALSTKVATWVKNREVQTRDGEATDDGCILFLEASVREDDATHLVLKVMEDTAKVWRAPTFVKQEEDYELVSSGSYYIGEANLGRAVYDGFFVGAKIGSQSVLLTDDEGYVYIAE